MQIRTRARAVRATILALTALLAISSAGCGDAKETGDKIKQKADEKREEIAQKIEQELVDYLTCAGVARQSTIDQIKAVLDGDELNLADLLSAPEDVASLVGLAGVTVEGYVLLAQNLRLLFEQGAVQKLITDGPPSLSCGDEITLSCTAGTGTTVVMCADGKITSVSASYDSCVLRGKKFNGGMTFTPDPMDDTKVGVSFESFTIDDNSEVVGAVDIDLDRAEEMRSLSVQAAMGLQLRSFGGHDGTLSCGQTLTLDRLVLDDTKEDVGVNFKGKKQTTEDTYALETTGEHLRWGKALDCACPLPGSGFIMELPRPLGRADETATLAVTFKEAPAGSTQCGSVEIDLPDWPTECSFLENPEDDCGKETARKVLRPLVGALCQPIPSGS